MRKIVLAVPAAFVSFFFLFSQPVSASLPDPGAAPAVRDAALHGPVPFAASDVLAPRGGVPPSGRAAVEAVPAPAVLEPPGGVAASGRASADPAVLEPPGAAVPSGEAGADPTVLEPSGGVPPSGDVGAVPAPAVPGQPGGVAPSGPALADPASFTDVGVARLSVTLDDGTESVTEGQRVTYTLTVTNDGGTTYRDARVSHVLPPGVRLRSAAGADTVGGGEITWRVSLTPGEIRALTVTADVVSGELTATACVAPAPGRALASCASDSDAYAASPARRAWAAAATIALTGIVVSGGALLLWRRASLDSRHRSGKAAR